MFGFPRFRTAASLLLIAALAIQPVAALGTGPSCPDAEGGACSIGPNLSHATCCRDAAPTRRCSGETPAAGAREPGCCCERSPAASDSPAQIERACTCGHFSQPLSDSGSRSTSEDQRTPSQVAFAAYTTADSALSGGEFRRVGVACPPSPPRFSQRYLCIWRL